MKETDKEQQAMLDGKTYKDNSFGKRSWCNHCYARTYTGCLLHSKQRTQGCVCHRAFERLKSFNQLSMTRQYQLTRRKL
jgi:hypothetical protein